MPKTKNISDNVLSDLADLFKIFSDSTRMRIMYKLFDGKASVGDIAENLDMSQSAISHQLRNLKKNNLVKCKRDGKSMLYSLADDHVKLIIETGLEHICEDCK
uniref:ArsR/SmtB family transcription factor n=1 Tax=Anaerococcus mediterraneensis TaxID=1870984 RepID=UPI00093134B8|nr:metalloregulator ArsR/SmtB family transcription factor [Anaerococcus mediterraneensis]